MFSSICRLNKSLSCKKGFTLLELLIVVAIIGILAAVAIPAFTTYRERAYALSVGSNLRNFATAFTSYMIENGKYPDDCHIVLPPGTGLDKMIAVNLWLAETQLGGNYNWEGPDNYPYAGIAILGATASDSVMRSLDRTLDDGNLSTGRFRKTPNGRHTYILDE